MKRFIRHIPTGLPSIIVLAVVSYLSLMPDPLNKLELNVFTGFDKVCHFLLYLVATIIYLLDYSKKKYPHHTKLNGELMVTTASMVIGLFMECAQLAMNTGRNFEINDIIANALGALAGGFISHDYLITKFRHHVLHHHHHHHHHHHEDEEPQDTGDDCNSQQQESKD